MNIKVSIEKMSALIPAAALRPAKSKIAIVITPYISYFGTLKSARDACPKWLLLIFIYSYQ